MALNRLFTLCLQTEPKNACLDNNAEARRD